MSEDSYEDEPKKGDRLFRGDLPDWQHNAVVNQCYRDVRAWSNYIDGYREAGLRLAKAVIEEGATLDTLVLPMVFLYRHHFELALKGVALLGARLRDEPETLKPNHDLLSLWSLARAVIEEHWPEANRETHETAEAIIGELGAVDAGSFAFRYPVSKTGDPSIANMELINVRHFVSVAERLSSFLRGCFDGLWNDLDQRETYLSDMMSMFGDDLRGD